MSNGVSLSESMLPLSLNICTPSTILPEKSLNGLGYDAAEEVESSDCLD